MGQFVGHTHPDDQDLKKTDEVQNQKFEDTFLKYQNRRKFDSRLKFWAFVIFILKIFSPWIIAVAYCEWNMWEGMKAPHVVFGKRISHWKIIWCAG
jgi:hypothetical protein